MHKSTKKLLKQIAKSKNAFDKAEEKINAAIAANKLDGTISCSIVDDLKDIHVIAKNIKNIVSGNELRTHEELSADVERQTQALRKKQACKEHDWVEQSDPHLTIFICSKCKDKKHH